MCHSEQKSVIHGGDFVPLTRYQDQLCQNLKAVKCLWWEMLVQVHEALWWHERINASAVCGSQLKHTSLR